MSDILPLATVKDRFSEIIDRVNRQHDRVVVTRNGVPTAVLVSVEELEALDETLDLMSSPNDMEAIRESIMDVEEGRTETLNADEARARWSSH